ncbi:hypothetical protein LEMLEM_LOCUS11223 [Lemmus lemmus]
MLSKGSWQGAGQERGEEQGSQVQSSLHCSPRRSCTLDSACDFIPIPIRRTHPSRNWHRVGSAPENLQLPPAAQEQASGRFHVRRCTSPGQWPQPSPVKVHGTSDHESERPHNSGRSPLIPERTRASLCGVCLPVPHIPALPLSTLLYSGLNS